MRRVLIPMIVLVLTAAACGDDDSTGTTATAPPTEAPSTTTSAPDTTTTTSGELPPPDPAEYTGAARVVNLYVDGDGATITVDVWGRRTFTNGPILLAEGIGFGEASDYFGAPEGYSIVLVPEGAGPDAEEIGGLFNAVEGEQTTTLWVWDDQNGTSSWLLTEADPEPANPIPPAPDAGSGLVILNAMQLMPHVEDSFARSFLVGDPETGGCLTQSGAIEPLNDDPIVGGTQNTYHEYPAGSMEFTLHTWPAPSGSEACSDEPLHGPYEVTVPDGGIAWVFLYTDDGFASIQRLEVPWG